MWARFSNTILGLFLMAAPAIFGYTNSVAATNQRIIGPIVVSFAVIAIWEETRPARKVNLLMGIALVLSPLLIASYGMLPTIISVTAGVLIALFSLVQGTYRPERFGGGWSVLWED